MPSFKAVLLASAIATSGLAAPSAKGNVGFHVHQIADPKKHNKLTPGAVLTARTYKKFGVDVPHHVAKAAQQSGSVTATPEQYDAEYLAPVNVGGSTLNLDFDTGSSDLWVFSSELPASERSGHSYYTVSSSKLYQGQSWDISYGDGSGASGNVYRDTVIIGGVTATSQAVEAATSVSSEFSGDTDTDGLVGLAFKSINTVTPTQQNTFFDNVLPSLPSPILTANLKKGAPGTYSFGLIPSGVATGAVTYVNVNTANGFWEFTSNGYAVGTGSFVSSSIDAIADTGTTLIYAPSALVKAYYAKVSGSSNSATYGGYVFPCSATLPNLTLGFGTYKSVVPGSYIKYAPVTTGSSTCFGGLQLNTGIGFSIYGDIWLKSQLIIFDKSVPRLGAAPKAT